MTYSELSKLSISELRNLNSMVIETIKSKKSLLALGPQVFVQQLLTVRNLKGSSDSAVRKHAVLLDVRSTDEHRGFNIGGQSLPLSDDFTDVFHAKHAERTKSIFIYCQSNT